MESLSGKVVIVTGASSGIGAGTASYLAKLGCRLVLTGRSLENLKKTEKDCLASGLKANQVVIVVGSVEKEADCKGVIAAAVDNFGQIDVLVNNAAFELVGNTETVAVDDLTRMFNVNLSAVLRLTQLALPYIKKTKGCIVNVSSVAAILPIIGTVGYGSLKAALDHMTRNMALDLGPQGVRVNNVNPGVIVSDFQKRAGMDEEKYQQFLKSVATAYPLRRVGQPDDVAKAIAFLASDLASFITGETLSVDGGHHLGAKISPWE